METKHRHYTFWSAIWPPLCNSGVRLGIFCYRKVVLDVSEGYFVSVVKTYILRLLVGHGFPGRTSWSAMSKPTGRLGLNFVVYFRCFNFEETFAFVEYIFAFMAFDSFFG